MSIEPLIDGGVVMQRSRSTHVASLLLSPATEPRAYELTHCWLGKHAWMLTHVYWTSGREKAKTHNMQEGRFD